MPRKLRIQEPVPTAALLRLPHPWRTMAFLTLAVLFLAWCSGCETPANQPPHSAALPARAENVHASAGIAFTDLPKPQAVVSAVLQAHGFLPPIFAPGPEPIVWAFTTRKRSDSDTNIVMAVVKLVPPRRADVQLSCYVFGPSEWGLLGRFFAKDVDAESLAMNNEMNQKLGK